MGGRITMCQSRTGSRGGPLAGRLPSGDGVWPARPGAGRSRGGPVTARLRPYLLSGASQQSGIPFRAGAGAPAGANALLRKPGQTKLVSSRAPFFRCGDSSTVSH